MATSTPDIIPTPMNLTSAEGPLVNRLHQVLNRTVERFQRSIKFSLFKEQYGRIYEENPEGLELAHNQLYSQLGPNIRRGLDQFCTSIHIDSSLSFLHNMIMKSRDSIDKIAWRPSGNPDEDVREHLYALKLKHKERLEEMLNLLRSRNEELMNTVIINHVEIINMKQNATHLNEEFLQNIHFVNGGEVNEIKSMLHDLSVERLDVSDEDISDEKHDLSNEKHDL